MAGRADLQRAVFDVVRRQPAQVAVGVLPNFKKTSTWTRSKMQRNEQLLRTHSNLAGQAEGPRQPVVVHPVERPEQWVTSACCH